MILEKKHDLQAEESQKRNQEETQLIEIRDMYKDSQLAANRENKKCKIDVCVGEEPRLLVV